MKMSPRNECQKPIIDLWSAELAHRKVKVNKHVFIINVAELVEEEEEEEAVKPKEEVTTLDEEIVVSAVTTIQAAFRGMKVNEI